MNWELQVNLAPYTTELKRHSPNTVIRSIAAVPFNFIICLLFYLFDQNFPLINDITTNK